MRSDYSMLKGAVLGQWSGVATTKKLRRIPRDLFCQIGFVDPRAVEHLTSASGHAQMMSTEDAERNVQVLREARHRVSPIRQQ